MLVIVTPQPLTSSLLDLTTMFTNELDKATEEIH